MKEMFEDAIQLATEQSTLIVRFDVQYNYEEQIHYGYMWLANGHEYKLRSGGHWHKEK